MIVVEDFHKVFDGLVAVAWIDFAGGPGMLLGLAWLVVAGIIAALVPLVAMAFDQFDSARHDRLAGDDLRMATMATSCWVLPFESADGPGNMALDEALLDAVADDPSAAALRTYDWTTPTLSLGYFQRWADALADPRWRDAPIVRRPTGGGAIWHDRELTYAVVVPGDHPLARPNTALYHAVHGAIADLLRSQGLAADRLGAEPRPDGARRPFLCFSDRDPADIVAGGVKVVGSAQRRRAGAVLQHGSVLLARSSATPELPGAGDLGPVSPDAMSWANRLRERIPAALGLRAQSRDVPEAVRRRARTLEQTVYRNPEWTRRR